MEDKNKKAEESIGKFGKHLRKLRLDRNMSQEALAYAAGITFSQISRMERGKINAGILNVFLIAEALGIPPKELFDFTVE